MINETREDKKLDISILVRNFEIDLFWKRSLFFWGFISSAFVGYASLRAASRGLAIVVACFGMVCSFAWTLLNRGSKYWQESWETKVERAESSVIGRFFVQEEKVQAWKGPWLSARKYSVSKLLIALSDYVFALWLVLVLSEIVSLYFPLRAATCARFAPGLFAVFSLVFLSLLWRCGRKSSRA